MAEVGVGVVGPPFSGVGRLNVSAHSGGGTIGIDPARTFDVASRFAPRFVGDRIHAGGYWRER